MTSAGNDKQIRVETAIKLGVPDRVPFYLQSNYLPAKVHGLTYRDAYYEQDKFLEAVKTFTLELDPDLYFGVDAPVITPGPIHDLWGTTQMKWPGTGIGLLSSHQFVEGEYMKQDEYDHFLDDPSDFLIRVYTPRAFTKLAGLGKLPPLKTTVLGCYGAGLMAGFFTQSETIEALEAILKAAKVGAEWGDKFIKFQIMMRELGQFASHTAPTLVPFDVISDLLRGMRGAMMDMFKVPDKLLAAEERLYPLMLNAAIGACQVSGNPRVFIPLHRGADGFMSPKQFEIFYWPFLKRMLVDLIDAGLTPMPFFEGSYNQRLEYLAMLPKGKILGMFDQTDFPKAKEMLKDVMCITGGMPVAALQVGTPEQVKAIAKNLIDVVGKDGGFIMGSGSVLDEAKPELVKVWIDYTKEYGRYA